MPLPGKTIFHDAASSTVVIDTCHHVAMSEQPFFFFFFISYRGLLFFLHLSCREFIGTGSQQLRPLPIGSHKVCTSGWSRLALRLNQGNSLASFPIWLFSFTCFRKLSWLLECFMYSICTRIFLASILAFTWFITMPTACWVTLWSLTVSPW